MSKPTIRQLEYLIALQETKSFSKAAALSNVTQSTLSAGILDLEESLQQRLVNRGRKNITLTSFGEETCESAQKIMTNIAFPHNVETFVLYMCPHFKIVCT